MSTLGELARTTRWARRLATWTLLLGSAMPVLADDAAPAKDAKEQATDEAKQKDSARCYSLWEVISGSICGVPCDDRSWTPLCCNTLRCEGWDQPWIAPPAGSGGGLRQGWINALDGFFTREWHLAYAFTDELADGSDAHLGLFQFQTPLSRRLWLGVDVPFVVGVDGDNGRDDDADFGDVVLTPRVMLCETQDTSISAGLGFRIPTGDENTGGNLDSVFPHLAVWQDLGCGWAFHGGTGLEVPTSESFSPDAVWVLNGSIGRTVTCHDATPFGDFTYYLSTTLRQDLGAADDHTFLSFTPGMRTHLGNDFYFLAGYEVPVTGPQSFDQRLLFVLVKGF